MSDYKRVFDRNRQGIKKYKEFKMTKMQKIILGYRKADSITRDQYGKMIG